MAKRLERAKAKGELASSLALVGAGIGAPFGGPVGAAIGGGVGAITGLIIGDSTTVFPMDMVAIPAYQAYMLTGTPAFQIFIKEGEVLTQVVATDAQVAEAIVEAKPKRKKRSKPNPWIAFNKRFTFRAKRKNEAPKEYFRLRQKAARIAYYKAHPERKKGTRKGQVRKTARRAYEK
tara:strand:- start:1239 stop:1769 length:531 start_codon:yes stop_codon:yes gene_type:complete